jgi:hypothetical protein
VLEDAFGAGVMEKLFSADEALRHRNLTPGAEPVRKGFYRHVQWAVHGSILSDRRKSCQPTRMSGEATQKKFPHS